MNRDELNAQWDAVRRDAPLVAHWVQHLRDQVERAEREADAAARAAFRVSRRRR